MFERSLGRLKIGEFFTIRWRLGRKVDIIVEKKSRIRCKGGSFF